MSREEQIEEMAQHLWVADENHDFSPISRSRYTIGRCIHIMQGLVPTLV